MNVLMEAIQAMKELRALELELSEAKRSANVEPDDSGYLTPAQEKERKAARLAKLKDAKKDQDAKAREIADFRPGAKDGDEVDPDEVDRRRNAKPSKSLRALAAASLARSKANEKQAPKRNKGGYGKAKPAEAPVTKTSSTTKFIPAQHKVKASSVVSKLSAGGRKMKLHTGANLSPDQKLNNLHTLHMVHRDLATSHERLAARHPEGSEKHTFHTQEADKADAKASALYTAIQRHGKN